MPLTIINRPEFEFMFYDPDVQEGFIKNVEKMAPYLLNMGNTWQVSYITAKSIADGTGHYEVLQKFNNLLSDYFWKSEETSQLELLLLLRDQTGRGDKEFVAVINKLKHYMKIMTKNMDNYKHIRNKWNIVWYTERNRWFDFSDVIV